MAAPAVGPRPVLTEDSKREILDRSSIQQRLEARQREWSEKGYSPTVIVEDSQALDPHSRLTSISLAALQRVMLVFRETEADIQYCVIWHALKDTHEQIHSSPVIKSFYERRAQEFVPIVNNSDYPLFIQLHGEQQLTIAPHATIEVDPQRLIYAPIVTVPNWADAPRTRGGVLCTFSSKVPERPLIHTLEFGKVKTLRIEEDLFDGYKISYQTIEEIQGEEGESKVCVARDQKKMQIYWIWNEQRVAVLYVDGRQRNFPEWGNTSPVDSPAQIANITISNRQGQPLVILRNTATSPE